MHKRSFQNGNCNCKLSVCAALLWACIGNQLITQVELKLLQYNDYHCFLERKFKHAKNKNEKLSIADALYLHLHLCPICFIQPSEGKQRVISWQEPVISVIETEVLKCSAIKWIPAGGIDCGSSHGQSPVDRLYWQVYCYFESWRRKAREKGAGSRAVWRIGAQSEGVEKSLHLNAPLHPNNSSVSGKKKRNTLCSIFPFLSSALLFIRAAVKGTRLTAIHLAVCVCAHMYRCESV